MIRNPAYYVIAHASRFVRLALVRVESSALARLPNVEFRTPSGRIVVIVLNRNRARQPITIRQGSRAANLVLPAGAVGIAVC